VRCAPPGRPGLALLARWQSRATPEGHIPKGPRGTYVNRPDLKVSKPRRPHCPLLTATSGSSHQLTSSTYSLVRNPSLPSSPPAALAPAPSTLLQHPVHPSDWHVINSSSPPIHLLINTFLSSHCFLLPASITAAREAQHQGSADCTICPRW
jgi:hypothetical protein